MKSRTILLTVTFFKTDLLVHFGNIQTCRQMLDKYEIAESEKIDIIQALGGKACNGMVWSGNTGKMLMYLGFPALKRMPTKDVAVLSHECLHVAFGLLEYCGIQTTDNEELLCMAQQMVFNSVMNEICPQ